MIYKIKKVENIDERKFISRLQIQKRFGVKAKRLENYLLIYPRFVKLISRKYAIEYFSLEEVLKGVKLLKSMKISKICNNSKTIGL